MILFDREHLGLMDVKVLRNGYGRQVASFEADVELKGEDEPVRGVFIRAPRVEAIGDDVEVVGRLDEDPVLVREGRILAASFHPELTDDTRIHERFLELVREERHVRA
jgi:5'-phosphate synthase pdxT subunit